MPNYFEKLHKTSNKNTVLSYFLRGITNKSECICNVQKCGKIIHYLGGTTNGMHKHLTAMHCIVS